MCCASFAAEVLTAPRDLGTTTLGAVRAWSMKPLIPVTK